MTADEWQVKFWGARTRALMSSATVGTAGIEILPASPNRIALLFGPCSAGLVTVGPVPAAQLVNGLGFNLQPNAGLMDFHPQNSGNAPCKPWAAIADAPGRLIGWIEVIIE